MGLRVWTYYHLGWEARDRLHALAYVPDEGDLPISKKIEEWCEDQFGRDKNRWEKIHLRTFIFRDEIDACAFKLRWF